MAFNDIQDEFQQIARRITKLPDMKAMNDNSHWTRNAFIVSSIKLALECGDFEAAKVLGKKWVGYRELDAKAQANIRQAHVVAGFLLEHQKRVPPSEWAAMLGGRVLAANLVKYVKRALVAPTGTSALNY